MKKWSSLYDSAYIGLLLGGIFFLIVFGLEILNPTNIQWLSEGDAAQHFLGWHFFRYEEWQFPPGKISSYGIPEGTSIVYTDSVPLFGFIFKLFRFVLPVAFQYLGIWILFCYLLQGLFGWLIAKKAFCDPIQRIIATCFFVLSPIMLKRAPDHQALVGHWVLLAAIYLFIISIERLKNDKSPFPFIIQWTWLISITALIHFYLCAMVLGVYLAAVLLWLLYSRFKVEIKQGLKTVIPFLLLFLTMYIAGYFVITSDSWGNGDPQNFGDYSMNLFAPFNPMGCNPYVSGDAQNECDSYFLKRAPFAISRQYEGFNYLGFGFLLLLTGAVGILFFNLKDLKSRWCKRCKPITVLILTCFLFFVFSTGGRVTFAGRDLFRISTAHLLTHVFNIFGSCGRFFWVPYYLISFGIFFIYGEFIKKKWLLTLTLIISLAFQVVDFCPFFISIHKAMTDKKYVNPLSSPRWDEVMQSSDYVLFFPESDLSFLFPLGRLAAQHKLGLNLLSAARVDQKAAKKLDFRVFNELKSGQLRAKALYVFSDQSIFKNLAQANKGERIFIQNVDGLYVAGLVQ